TGFCSISSFFFLLAASLSLNGLSLNSGQTAETNAIVLPSGDQSPVSASVLSVVSCRASPPSRSMSHSCEAPERLDVKRIFLPAGDQRRWLSFLPAALVSWRGGVLPSVAASHSADELLLAARSTLPTT